MRQRKCRACDGWHDLESPWPRACAAHFAPPSAGRSSLPRPYVIRDSLGEGVQGLRNMADGQMYDSRSQYLKAVKAAGCEVVGNDELKTYPAPDLSDVGEYVKEAGEQLGVW